MGVVGGGGWWRLHQGGGGFLRSLDFNSGICESQPIPSRGAPGGLEARLSRAAHADTPPSVVARVPVHETEVKNCHIPLWGLINSFSSTRQPLKDNCITCARARACV